MNFHCQGGVSDSSADKCGVENKSLNKAVMRSSQNPVVFRLVNRANGIGSCVNHDSLREALNNHADCTGKNGFYEFINA